MDSNNNDGINRRTFIVGVSAGVVGATCSAKKREKKASPPEDAAKIVAASPREALVTLCLVIGPWAATDVDVAEEFLGRFLSPKRVESFAEHAKAIQSLPSHLPQSGSGKLDKIPLSSLSAADKAALMAVLNEIYRMEEVRYYVCGEPNAGVCLSDIGFIAKVPT